jgi:hypothetical protein
MPKIRDLGINAIPPTMRPLEVGDFGYRLGGGTMECPDGTCDDDDDDVEEDEDKDKSPPSPKDGKDRDGRVLNTLAIAQLREQLNQHIANI